MQFALKVDGLDDGAREGSRSDYSGVYIVQE